MPSFSDVDRHPGLRGSIFQLVSYCRYLVLKGRDTLRMSLPALADQPLRMYHGTEFTSKALDHWAYSNRVELNFSRPNRPGDNPHIEAFNSVVRRECLTQHWFVDLRDAQSELDRWRLDYNTVRPHGSLQRSTPAQVGAGTFYTPGPERLRNLRSWRITVGGGSLLSGAIQ